MNNMIFDNLPQIIDISNEEIKNRNCEYWAKIIGEKTKFGDVDVNETCNDEVFSEQDISILEKLDDEDELLINETPDEIFFSSKVNCIIFFGVFEKSNSLSSVFIKSNVINPFSIYNEQLHACGCPMINRTNKKLN